MWKKNYTWIKMLLCISLFIYLVLFSIDFFQPRTLDKIKSGRISFTQELGWVNWGHAIPTNAMNGIEELNKLEDVDSMLSIYMQVKSHFFGFDLMGECKRDLSLASIKDSIQLRYHFYSLFRQASSDLETYQGDLPFSLLSVSKESSFREGDLMGNLISVYLAETGMKIADFRKSLTDYSVEKSILSCTEFHIQKHNWDSVESIANKSSVSVPFYNFVKTFFKGTQKEINSSLSKSIYFN